MHNLKISYSFQKILETLYCGSDELECLIDKTAEDLLNSVPIDWLNTEVSTLPRKNPVEEKGHSWIITDKNILMDAPMDYWKKSKGSNNIPIVIGKFNSYIHLDDKAIPINT